MHSQDDLEPEQGVEQSSISKLMSADQVKAPEVLAWHFSDLEQEQKQQAQKIRDEVYQQIQRELEPQISRQTAILKREAYEEAKQAGYEEGYRAGFETGQAQGIETAQKTAKDALQPKVERLDAILSQLIAPQKQVSSEVFVQMAQFCLLVSQRLVEGLIEVDTTRIVRFVEEAIAHLPEPDAPLTVELHPDDVSIVEYYSEQQGRHWQLISNSDLLPGTCRVKSLNSVIQHNWRENQAELFKQVEALIREIVGRYEIAQGKQTTQSEG